jgi:hypothetical protein
MNLITDDQKSTVVVYDWDSSDWSAQSSTIQDSYTIEFQPSIDVSDLESITNGREVYYDKRIVYDTVPFGTGYITAPRQVYAQQLLPKPVSQ